MPKHVTADVGLGQAQGVPVPSSFLLSFQEFRRELQGPPLGEPGRPVALWSYGVGACNLLSVGEVGGKAALVLGSVLYGH